MKEFTAGYEINGDGLRVIDEQTGFGILDESVIWGRPKWEINHNTGHIHVAADFEFEYDYESSNLWSIDSEIEMKLRKENGEEVVKTIEYRVEKDSTKFTIENNIHVGDLRALGNGVFWFSKIHVHLNFRIKSVTGLTSFSSLRSFKTSTNSDSEICLILGENRYYVDKLILMFSSPIFRKLLTENDELTELEIEKDEGFDNESFEAFLLLLYNEMDSSCSVGVCQGFLCLAYKYDVQSIISNSEDFLMDDSNVYTCFDVWLSGLFAFSKLQAEILKHSSLGRIEYAVEFMMNQKKFFENESEYTVCKQIAIDKTVEAFLIKLCELFDEEDEVYETESKKVPDQYTNFLFFVALPSTNC